MIMRYSILAFIFILVIAPFVNSHQGQITIEKIDNIFNNLTLDLMGEKDDSNLSANKDYELGH